MQADQLTATEIRESLSRLASKLTPPRKRFADIWLSNGNNGTPAYLDVFFTKKPSVAATGASKLLHRSDVRSYVDLCKQYSTCEILDHLSVTKERVLDEESKLAFIDIRLMFDPEGNFLPPRFWPEQLARAISGIDVDQSWDKESEQWKYKYKIKMNDKGRALGRLETVLGMNKADGLNDADTNLFKSFMESIDGKTRGVLPSEMEEDKD